MCLEIPWNHLIVVQKRSREKYLNMSMKKSIWRDFFPVKPHEFHPSSNICQVLFNCSAPCNFKNFCGQREKTRTVIINLFMGLNSLVVTWNSCIKRNANNYGNIIAVANNMDRLRNLFWQYRYICKLDELQTVTMITYGIVFVTYVESRSIWSRLVDINDEHYRTWTYGRNRERSMVKKKTGIEICLLQS